MYCKYFKTHAFHVNYCCHLSKQSVRIESHQNTGVVLAINGQLRGKTSTDSTGRQLQFTTAAAAPKRVHAYTSTWYFTTSCCVAGSIDNVKVIKPLT